MRKNLMISLMIAVLLLAGCSKEDKKDQVSEGATKVIEAMMTCPNPDLFDPASVTHIGLGAEPTEEEKAQAEAVAAKVLENWEKAVGAYFAPNCFDSFYNQSASMYLFQAATEGTPLYGKTIAVKEIKLEEKTKSDSGDWSAESVQVTLTVGEEEQTVKMEFRYDADGLITSVTMS